MKRLISPFFLILTAIVAVGYAYASWRLTTGAAAGLALALPFMLIWVVPVVYWIYERESVTTGDEILHIASYLSMGWLNFLIFFSLVRDALQWLASMAGADGAAALLRGWGTSLVFATSLVALGLSVIAARRGPHVRTVTIRIEGLDPALDGLRIVQISDLHVGPTVREWYVRRVVEQTNALEADFVALTGDMVDGPVARLAPHVAPLADLMPRGRAYFVLGNHDCYAGAGPWIAHFRALGMQVLLNEHATISHNGAPIVIGGVLDPAIRLSDPTQSPRPDLASAPQAGRALRVLLAHNPRLAPLGAAAGFDLQLSGHTHAGQFFPWTLAVHLVHAPHVAGLSRLGRMWVYVSAGTGTWGPPLRFGTEPELTLLRIVAATQSA